MVFCADVSPHDSLTAGLDEVGRGCIAGPVIAAAVILDPHREISGLTDSKKLSARKRQSLAIEIRQQAMAWSLGRAEASEIDRLNILQASLLAMSRAYNALPVKPERALVDGIFYPPIDCPGSTVKQGDLKVPQISAASILAKVARDCEMLTLDLLYPDYGFLQHKGYPTRMHLEKIASLGITPLHRRSFAPVRRLVTVP